MYKSSNKLYLLTNLLFSCQECLRVSELIARVAVPTRQPYEIKIKQHFKPADPRQTDCATGPHSSMRTIMAGHGGKNE